MRLIDADALDEKLEVIMVRYAALGRKSVAEDYNFVRTVLLTAPTIEVPTWIPVTERLPDEWTYVLVLTKAGSQIIAARSGRFWREHYTHQKLVGDVSHWMPLPDAPMEDSNA